MRVCLAFVFAVLMSTHLVAADPVPLPNTAPLTMEGDVAMQLVEGVDKFLLRKIDASAAARDKLWPMDVKPDQRETLAAEKRQRLALMLGVRDQRVAFESPELLETTTRSARLAEADTYRVYAVRWPTIGDMFAEGLLLQPEGVATGNVVVIPDADQTPEQITGLAEGLPAESQYGRHAAEAGMRVLIPTLISRRYAARNGRSKMTDREFIYRSAFELGRHIIGYELQEVLAGVDWFAKQEKTPISVIGYGEGGMLALYAGAIDPRILTVLVSGYFDRKEDVWLLPIDRNLFGVLNEVGNAEVVRLIQDIYIESSIYPAVTLPSEGGAPGVLARANLKDLEAEENRITARSMLRIDHAMRRSRDFLPREHLDSRQWHLPQAPSQKLTVLQAPVDPAARQARLLHAMDRHNQQLLAESPYVRAEFMKGLDTSSPEAYAKTVEPYREKFKREVIGWFDDERLPANPRSRQIIDKEKYTGYEVVLDVWPDVIAYGILLLPKDIKPNERRPVVVCQHGLEGRPQDIIQGDHSAYHDFAAKLAERGFITFSPQNLYIGKDKFRTLQRKANPLGKTLFSIIIPQHQQIVAWLQTLPQVDAKRIAFYGLSYGGKSAMRIPPLVPEYCLSICSADFNDWVWKNASSRSPYSYVWTNEYEIFEWDLGSTFSYAEMAALIAPRPFMVERGHADGVAPDEAVGAEFAKVYRHYNARLKIGDRCEIEWFDGPHTINGRGTFKFLHKHLQWPES